MKALIRSTVYGCLMGILAVAAHAGTVIQQEGGEIGAAKKSKVTLYLDSGKLRVETQEPDGKNNIVIFDGAKQVMYMISPSDNSYRELDKATVDAMGQQMSKAMEQMQAQMANMPPQQRAMMEEMMKKNMGGMMGGAQAKPTITLKEMGSEKVGAFNTTHYEMLSNGEKTQEIWAAPYDQAKLSPADFKTFQDMSKFFESVTRNVPKGSYSFSSMEQLKGYPVKMVQFTSGKPTHEWDLISVDQKSIDGSQFTVPAGMKKMEMPGMGGPMGGGPPGRRMGQ